MTYKEFAGVDHGFTHAKPASVAREALWLIGEHLRKAHAVPSQRDSVGTHTHAVAKSPM